MPESAQNARLEGHGGIPEALASKHPQHSRRLGATFADLRSIQSFESTIWDRQGLR